MTLDFNIHSITPVEESGSITPSGTKVITENGEYNVTSYATASVNVEGTAPTLTELTVTPSTTSQTITPIEDGFSTVTVEAVTASIDSDIVAGNIKSGVNILGVSGTVTELAGTTTTITTNGTYVPTGGANGFTSVSVNVAGTTPTGTYTITTNGAYDVTNYANADVNVSGGGGKFDEIDTMVSDAVTWLEDKSYANCYNNGWLVASDKQTSTSLIYFNAKDTVSGVVFSTNIPDEIYVRGKAFKAPTGSTISTEGLSNSICKITFPSGCTNKWLIAAGEISMSTSPMYGFHQIAFVTDPTTTLNCTNIADQYRYINIGLRQSTYTSQNPYSLNYPTLTVWQQARNLEGLTLSDNIKFTLTTYLSGSDASFLSYLAFSENINLKDFFEKHISDAIYQTTVLNTSISDDLIRSNSKMAKWLNRKDFPLIIDCSGFPSSALSNTWYVGYVPYNMTNYGTDFGGFTDIKIKLPAMNIRLNYDNNRFYPIEYIKYMADNAPTVSGKTFKLGTALLAIVQSIDSSIVTTLTNKGWTVS